MGLRDAGLWGYRCWVIVGRDAGLWGGVRDAGF